MSIDFLLSDALRARLLKAGIPAEHHNRAGLRTWLLHSYGSAASPDLTLQELAEVILYLSEKHPT